MADCQRIKRDGGTARFSIASITCMSINLPDAKKRLTGEEFEKVYLLFKRLRKCKSKIELDIDGYHDLAARIVLMFDNIAPYEKYSGMDEIEAKLLIKSIRELYGDDPGFADDIVNEITHGGKGGNKPKKRWGAWFICAVLAVTVCVLGYLLLQKQEQLAAVQKQANDIADSANLYIMDSAANCCRLVGEKELIQIKLDRMIRGEKERLTMAFVGNENTPLETLLAHADDGSLEFSRMKASLEYLKNSISQLEWAEP